MTNEIIVICGQTATGKTKLSLEIAQYLREFHNIKSEIMSADSRQIYCGLNITSNKIAPAEMNGIPHYGLDIAKPGTRYTVHDFQTYARQKIEDILLRNETVMLCGGTGLYIDATLFNEFDFDPNKKGSIDYPNATYWEPRKTNQTDHVWIGLYAPREWLSNRITQLATQKQRLILDEIQTLLNQGISRDWIHGLGLEPKYAIEVIEHTITPDQYIDSLVRDTLQYTKRQMTWFKRNPRIQWFDVSQQSHAEIIRQVFL